MATPHNTAEKGQIAKTCILPGDPLRAKLVAETYLDNAKCFNTTRGMLGYTGSYKGHELSVMGHGMGMPSVGIYSFELYSFYGVEQIIRFGSMGGIHPELRLGDIVIAQGACTDSNFANQYGLPGTFAPIADYGLLYSAVQVAAAQNVATKVGNVLSSDVFYQPQMERNTCWAKMGVLGVEMECAALYMNAAYLGKRALGILTVSDILGDYPQAMSAEDRQVSFKKMIHLTLETAVSAK